MSLVRQGDVDGFIEQVGEVVWCWCWCWVCLEAGRVHCLGGGGEGCSELNLGSGPACGPAVCPPVHPPAPPQVKQGYFAGLVAAGAITADSLGKHIFASKPAAGGAILVGLKL